MRRHFSCWAVLTGEEAAPSEGDMSRARSLHRRVPLAAALLCLAACVAACIAGCASGSDNPTQSRVGTWRGETEFGSFSFTVCEGGRKITAYTLEYTTGGATQALALGGGDEVLVDKEGTFDLSAPEAGVVFRGQFNQDGKSASGVWEITAPGGDTVSEEWVIDR